MADEKEIEESLRVCQEIEEFLIHDDMEEEYDISQAFDFDNETFREIDKILEEEQRGTIHLEQTEKAPEKEAEKETEEEPEKEREPDPEEEPKQEKEEALTAEKQELQLEAVAEELAETEIGIGIADQDETTEEYREKHPFLRATLSLLICIVVALILSLVITRYVAHHTSVEGSSMEPTLTNGDQLIVENISYYLHEPERFDVVVFPFSNEVSYIKRIIGLPGESIQIKDGTIYINGEELTENYGKETIEDPGLAQEEIVLGDDEYFVLGDNRNASVDSRKAEVGTIKKSQIKGKAWLRFYPFSQITTIE